MKKQHGQSLVPIVVVVTLGALVAAADEPKTERAPFDKAAFRNLLFHVLEVTTNGEWEAPHAGWPVTRVVGRVLDADGHPVPDARVAIAAPRSHVDTWYHVNCDTTDEEGRFLVRGLPEQRRLVVETSSLMWEVTLAPGQNELTIELPRPVDVRIVPGESWAAADQIQIIPMRQGSRTGRPVDVVTVPLDATQQADVAILPGLYRVTYVRRVNVNGSEQRISGEVQRWHVEPEGERTLRLGAEGCQVHGQVFVTSPAAIRLTFVTSTTPYEYRTLGVVFTDEDGKFQTGPLPPGPCLVRLERLVTEPAFPVGGVATALAKIRTVIPDADSFELVLAVPPPTPPDTAGRVRQILDQEGAFGRNDPRLGAIQDLEDRASAVRELVRILHDNQAPWSWRQFCVRALGGLDPLSDDARAGLVDALDVPELWSLRTSVAGALAERGVHSGFALERLLALSRDEAYVFRGGIIAALGRMAQDAPSQPRLVASLIGSLDDPDGRVRQTAADHLGRLGADAAIPALRAGLDDPFGPARAMNAWMLFRLTDEAQPAVDTLVEVLRGPDLHARWTAAIALTTFDSRAAAAIPALEENAAFHQQPPYATAEQSLRWRIKSNCDRALTAIRP